MCSKLPLALIGCDSPKEIATKLEAQGFRVCILAKDTRLPPPVASHADMLLFSIKNRIFSSAEYTEKNVGLFNLLTEYGYKAVACNKAVSNKYPHDVAFNLALIGNRLYGNIPHNATEIIDFARENEIPDVTVKQGYTKCSTVILGENAIITADSGIAASAETNGIDVLKIENSPSAVRLSGYDYGFLGGACGVYKNKIYFTGDIYAHPFGSLISKFCAVHGFEIVSVFDGQLTDIGGIIFLPPLI